MHGTTEPDDQTNNNPSNLVKDITEQKGRPRQMIEQHSIQVKRSQILGPNIEENKQTLNDLLKATEKSKVETDYVKRVSDRKISSAISWYGEPSLEPSDEKISTRKENILENYGSSFSQSKAVMSSAEDFFGHKKPFNRPITNLKKSIDIKDTENVTSIENTDFFNHVLPSNMTAYDAEYFRDPNVNTNLNNKLLELSKVPKNSLNPFINSLTAQKHYFQGQFFQSPENYITISDQMNEAEVNKPQSSLPKHQMMVTPRMENSSNMNTNRSRGNKTTGAHTPNILPSLHTSRSRANNNNKNKDLDISGIKHIKQHLDTTNKTNLDQAYKNILPNEAKMMEDYIELKHKALPMSGNYRKTRNKSNSKNFFKRRFKSIEKRSKISKSRSNSPNVTPIQK